MKKMMQEMAVLDYENFRNKKLWIMLPKFAIIYLFDREEGNVIWLKSHVRQCTI